jgi:hypothetical protein
LLGAGAQSSVDAVGELQVGASEAQSVARAAFDWVEAVAVKVDGGLAWLADGEQSQITLWRESFLSHDSPLPTKKPVA